MHPFGYPFHSAVGRSPWTARDAPVSLPDAEAGASARARVPAPHDFAGYIWLRQGDTHLHPNQRDRYRAATVM